MPSGLQAAPPSQRAAFGALSSYAATICAARALNYVRERRRALPVVRSIVRRARRAPAGDRVRVHHFLPGIGLAFAAGAASIALREDGRELALSVPFGVGAALTFDEIALLLGREKAYWATEGSAAAQAGAAALGAFGLAVSFRRSDREAVGQMPAKSTRARRPGAGSSSAPLEAPPA